MASPTPRSVNRDLQAGLTDGRIKKIVQDRGGIVEGTTYAERSQLKDVWYGIHENPAPIDQFGRVAPDPYFTPTAPPSLDGC